MRFVDLFKSVDPCECEVIEIYDGFAIRHRKTGSWLETEYAIYEGDFTRKKQRRKVFKCKVTAIARAKREEEHERSKLFRAKQARLQKKLREGFNERKVWR